MPGIRRRSKLDSADLLYLMSATVASVSTALPSTVTSPNERRYVAGAAAAAHVPVAPSVMV